MEGKVQAESPGLYRGLATKGLAPYKEHKETPEGLSNIFQKFPSPGSQTPRGLPSEGSRSSAPSPTMVDVRYPMTPSIPEAVAGLTVDALVVIYI